jgi:hypothetical protein
MDKQSSSAEARDKLVLLFREYGEGWRAHKTTTGVLAGVLRRLADGLEHEHDQQVLIEVKKKKKRCLFVICWTDKRASASGAREVGLTTAVASSAIRRVATSPTCGKLLSTSSSVVSATTCANGARIFLQSSLLPLAGAFSSLFFTHATVLFCQQICFPAIVSSSSRAVAAAHARARSELVGGRDR